MKEGRKLTAREIENRTLTMRNFEGQVWMFQCDADTKEIKVEYNQATRTFIVYSHYENVINRIKARHNGRGGVAITIDRKDTYLYISSVPIRLYMYTMKCDEMISDKSYYWNLSDGYAYKQH